MGAWTLPVAAAAFAAGLVAWPAMPAWVEPWMLLGVGCVALIVAWLGAGRPATGTDALVGAGLLPPDAAAVEALAPGRTEARAPLGAAAFAVVGMFALGVGWGGFRDRALDTAFLARLAPERVTIEGTLKTDPGTSTFGWSAEVYVRSVMWRDGAVTVRSSIWASGDGPRPRARRGDRLSLEGVVRVPDDPGFAEALRHKGIPAQLQIDSFAMSGGSANLFVRATQATRRAVGHSITRVFPPREAGLLLGLVLGDDSELEPGMERDFRAAGLSHLLVVSGENVAMILAPVLAAVALLRLSRWPRFLVGLGTVAFFTVLTGAEPSVLRAGVMAGLALIGVLMGRPRAIASILSAAVLALLVLDPWLIWSVGFQLSVAATAGMVSVASPMAAWWARVTPKPLAIAAGASMAAQLGVTPILLTHFGEVPLVTLPANLLAFPLVAPALLLGVLASALGLIWLPLGSAIGALARLPMQGLELIADRLGKAPIGYLTSQEGPFVLIVGSIVVIALIVWIRTRWRPPRAMTVAAVAAFPLLVWASALAAGPPSGLMMRFFDVGQGDAALLTTPEGASVLFDGGPDEEQVARELAAVGLKRLDVVVASHPHADHIVGLPAVLTRVPVGLLLQPGCPDVSPLQADLEQAIDDENVPVRTPRAGDTFWLGSLRLDILSPDRCWVGTESDTNNDAIVVRASYLGHVVLIASEPEEPAQEVLLESGVDLRADVLKVPHHGAATSIPEFFDAVGAAVAVVSVGENDYGHPVPTTLDAIVASGAEVWRTDRAGTITISFAGRTPTIESERWPAAALP